MSEQLLHLSNPALHFRMKSWMHFWVAQSTLGNSKQT